LRVNNGGGTSNRENQLGIEEDYRVGEAFSESEKSGTCSDEREDGYEKKKKKRRQVA